MKEEKKISDLKVESQQVKQENDFEVVDQLPTVEVRKVFDQNGKEIDLILSNEALKEILINTRITKRSVA